VREEGATSLPDTTRKLIESQTAAVKALTKAVKATVPGVGESARPKTAPRRSDEPHDNDDTDSIGETCQSTEDGFDDDDFSTVIGLLCLNQKSNSYYELPYKDEYNYGLSLITQAFNIKGTLKTYIIFILYLNMTFLVGNSFKPCNLSVEQRKAFKCIHKWL